MALTKILPGALGAGAVDSTAAVATGAIQADDLQAGTITANKLGAGSVVSGVINTACVIDLNDNIKTRWGTSQDLEIYHSGSHGYLHNNTGRIRFETDNLGFGFYKGAGAETLAMFNIDAECSLYYNNAKEFQTVENGIELTSNTSASGTAQTIYLSPTSVTDRSRSCSIAGVNTDGNNNQALVFKTSAAATPVERLKITSDGRVRVPDNGKFVAGGGDDLQIYHDGSNSYIQQGSVGHLKYQANNHDFYNQAGSEFLLRLFSDNAVHLFFNGDKKFETNSSGAQVTGSFVADSVAVGDSEFLLCGNDDDLKIFHDGTHNTIKSANNRELHIKDTDDGYWIRNEVNGAVSLYYDGSSRFVTHTSGCKVSAGNLYLDRDDAKVVIGDSDDLEIYHSGGDNIINCKNDKNLYIKNDHAGGNESMAIFDPNGAVELFNDGIKRLETWGDGVKTFGNYFETNNVTTYNVSFYQQSNQSYSYDINVGSEGGNGNSFWLVCGFNHFYNTAYGCHRVGMFSARTTSVDTIFQDQQTSGNAGAWSVSKPNSTTFRVTKSAGSYSGWGHGFVQLTFRKI